MDCENKCCALEDGPRRDVNAEGLDNHVYALECISDRIAIERVAGHLLEVRILDWYACRRTCQGANVMTGEKGGLYSFKSDAAAGTYDQNLGHAFLKSYCFSTQW